MDAPQCVSGLCQQGKHRCPTRSACGTRRHAETPVIEGPHRQQPGTPVLVQLWVLFSTVLAAAVAAGAIVRYLTH